jgi:hypothetical protein
VRSSPITPGLHLLRQQFSMSTAEGDRCQLRPYAELLQHGADL